MRHKDGRWVWISVSGAAIRNSSGAIVNLMGIFRDITAMKEAADDLRRAHARTAAVLANVADTFFSLDREFRFVMVNPAAEKAPLGRPAGELIGKVIWDVFPALAGTPVQRFYQNALEMKSLEHHENMSRVNGRWYEGFVQRHDDGIDVYLRDITDRTSSDTALRESEEKFRMLVENSNDIIYTLTAEGVFRFVSPAWTSLLRHLVS
jgi:PAS domain S-box-containing protein